MDYSCLSTVYLRHPYSTCVQTIAGWAQSDLISQADRHIGKTTQLKISCIFQSQGSLILPQISERKILLSDRASLQPVLVLLLDGPIATDSLLEKVRRTTPEKKHLEIFENKTEMNHPPTWHKLSEYLRAELLNWFSKYVVRRLVITKTISLEGDRENKVD